jgi:predicted nucleic acid-binding protein
MVQMVTAVVSRAAEPFPIPVRTLDALHLATLEFLRGQSIKVELATYDARMRDAAKRMKIPLCKF